MTVYVTGILSHMAPSQSSHSIKIDKTYYKLVTLILTLALSTVTFVTAHLFSKFSAPKIQDLLAPAIPTHPPFSLTRPHYYIQWQLTRVQKFRRRSQTRRLTRRLPIRRLSRRYLPKSPQSLQQNLQRTVSPFPPRRS